MISGKVTQPSSVKGKMSAGGGTTDHTRLTNRDAKDQHPITAIEGLSEELNKKLDAETAMPLIEDAVKNKAKGLFFDVNKEFASKSYWYLTSEIDPVTKQGLKTSIISGPYDLGAGGGGGGGGVTKVTLSIATDPTTGKPMWPYNISVGAKCEIGITWSSKRDDEPTGRGTLYVYVAGKLVETRTATQGLVKFDLTDYIISGDNKVEIKVVDAYSTTKNLVDNINGVVLKLASNFEDDLSYTGNITFPYTPTGSIRKYVYFILDGEQYGDPEIVDTTAEQWTKTILAEDLSHGSHSLKVYFTCTIDGEDVRSNELYYDIIYYEAGRSDPIIASPFIDLEQEQYVAFNIKYRVYTPGKNTSDVELYIDSKKSKDLTVDTLYQVWENRFDDIGNHVLEIRTGTVYKTFNIHVNESTIHVDPVTQGLSLYLSSSGRSNAEPIEERAKWDYIMPTKTVEGKLSGFNWASNGWVQDENGATVLRVSGDARVSVEYKPFENDFTITGKTLEFELSTTDVKNYEARILECLDGSDTITSSQAYAGEDTRTKRFIISSVDNNKFIEKVIQVKGTYMFIYNGSMWDLDGVLISTDQLLSEYGITLNSIDIDTGSTYPIDNDHLMVGDKTIIYYTVSGKGFYITPQLAKLQSQQSSLSTQYKEGDKVRLAFVVEKRTEGTEAFKTKLMYMYINGILSGVSRYSDSDSFLQSPPVYITIGSNDATVDIYNIRIYDNNLTRRQIVNNWIADTRDPVLKAKRYKHNDNYDDVGKISLDKIAQLGDLPYMVVTGESLPAYKKDRKYVEVKYTNPANSDRDFTAVDARMDVQGTSSQYYYKKNFKIKYEGGFEDIHGNWSEHYKLRGEDSKKEKTFVYKADVASSEGANNVELVRYFEDTKNWFSPPELLPDEDIPGSTDSKKRIRVGIDGLPIVMFHDNTKTTEFYGKMNFNNDKGNDRTFGFKDGDECWEFLHNTSDLVLFKSIDSFDINWQDSFEARFPEENSAGDPYGTNPNERKRLREVVKWVTDTRRLSTDTESEKQRKLNKFKVEFETYFNKTSSLFYYLYTELFLMVDSRAKNAMLCYYKSRQPGDGGDKWFWIPYDMDTALGINNEGLLVFNYDKEDTDTQNGSFIFNGQDSTFWMNVRDAFKDDLKIMYNELRSTSTSDRKNWSFEGIDKYFSDHQSVWSESIFNEDAYTKYLEPYVNNQDATYLGMTQGSKEEQRRWWLDKRFKYIDSKYLTGDAKGINIMLRAYAKSDFTITPFMNCYATAVFDQATAGLTVTEKVEKGVPKVLASPAGWDPHGVDSVVILYSADQLQDIGDISGFKPGYADFSSATKLSRLQIGNASSGYTNENLRGINVGANRLLTYLDARNCTNLGTDGKDATPVVDLSNCTSIEEVYFEGTQIKGCEFPVGGNLKVVHLPETLASLTIRNHPNLTDFKLAGTNYLTSLWLEDIPSSVVDAYSYIMSMPDESRVRLININNLFNSEADIKLFYDKLDMLHGLDAKGDYTEKVQITGTIRVESISYAGYVSLSARYPEVKIVPDRIICTVKFYDANGEEIIDYRQSLTQSGNAAFPGQLIAEPEDWDKRIAWDWDDGYVYDEENKEFINSPHNHYNNYYKLAPDRLSFAPVLINEEFKDKTYYQIPEKAYTESKYYVFTNWDKSLINVQTDLDVYPVYQEFDRHYIVESDTHTLLIWAIPRKEDVIYNNYSHRSALSELPPEVTLVKWSDNETGEIFNYESEEVGSRSVNLIKSNKHIVATWNDSGTPVFEDLSRKTYKTIHYKAVDNVGIIAYAVTNTSSRPTEWISIESTPVWEGIYEVSHAGSWYFWVKDENENINTASFLTCYSISKNLVEGMTSVTLLENDEEIQDFALNGTKAKIAFSNDFHYEFVDQDGVFVNGIKVEQGEEIEINSNKNITTAISPRSYTVKFDLCGRGDQSKAQDQEIIYKQHVTRPTEQYDRGFVIGTWYLNYQSGQYDTPWDFDNDILDETIITSPDITSITLYAEWNEATMPTIITVEVPEITPSPYYDTTEYDIYDYEQGKIIARTLKNKEVTVAYNQNTPNATTVNWGDGTESEIAVQVGNVRLAHVYNNAGTYEIQIQKRPGYGETTLLLGGDQINRAVNPSPYVTNINFAYDITTTNAHAFRETNISTLNLTPYMTSIAANAFTANKKITQLEIPEGIIRIGQDAFTECSYITLVKFPSTLLEIDSGAFDRCTSLSDISTIEYTKLKKIQNDAFISCALTTVILPETLEVLGGENGDRGVVFRYCNNLIKVILKSKILTTVGTGNFEDCPYLTSAGPIGSNCSIEYAWETQIPNNAFCGRSTNLRTNIESIEFPTTINWIGDNSFAYGKFKSISLPALIKHIGKNAFRGNNLLTGDLVIPSTVTYLGYGAFSYCGAAEIYLYSTAIDEQKTSIDYPLPETPEEEEKYTHFPWFWKMDKLSYTPQIHVQSSITDVEVARAVYGYYWNFTTDADYLSWAASGL